MENQRGERRTDADGLSVPQVLDLLSAERRRYVLALLREMPTPVATADLARRIAAWEAEQSDEAPPDRTETVYQSLYHCHVPKLAAAEVVEHDRERNTVAPGESFDDLWDSAAAFDDADRD